MASWLKSVFLIGVAMASSTGFSAETPEQDAARQRMIAAVSRDVERNASILGRPHLTAAVEDALLTVPRHLFVPTALRDLAYENRALPIGLGQTISQPTVVALMTDLLALGPGAQVLEVGTGSGYQAAVLASVVTAGHIHTIEIVPDLARRSRALLSDLGYTNVTVHTGDGYAGLPEHAPFAGVIVTAAADHIPQPLIDQLAPGGVLVMPVGPAGDTQWLTVLKKEPGGAVTGTQVLPVRFVPLTGRAEER